MTPDREKELQARITNAATLYTLECETSDALRAEIALMRATIEELRKAAPALTREDWRDIANGRENEALVAAVAASPSSCVHDEIGAARIQLARISGALCDAATVVVYDGDYARSIHELTDERDGYRSALADLVAATPVPWGESYKLLKAWVRARDVLKDGPRATPTKSNT